MSIKRFNPTCAAGGFNPLSNIPRAAQRGLTWALGLIMRHKIYAIGICIIAISVLFAPVAWGLSLLGLSLRDWPLFTFITLYRDPVPPIVRVFLPHNVNFVLSCSFAALVIRRLWLFTAQRSLLPPSSFTLIPYVLTYISVVCVALSTLGVLGIAITEAFYQPAMLLAIPAIFLLSPVTAWVEIRSLVPGRSTPA